MSLFVCACNCARPVYLEPNRLGHFYCSIFPGIILFSDFLVFHYFGRFWKIIAYVYGVAS